MTKCPDCAEETIFDSLFCKHCGRCLLPPDPDKVQWAIVTHTEQLGTSQRVDFYNAPMVENSSVVLIERSHLTARPIIVGGLLLLNLLVIILVAQLVIYLTG